MKKVFDEGGLPTDPEKDEGPATKIGPLEIELDTEAMEVCVPREKLRRLQTSLASWRGTKACKNFCR